MQERRANHRRHDASVSDRLDNAVQQRGRTVTAPVGVFVGDGKIDFLRFGGTRKMGKLDLTRII